MNFLSDALLPEFCVRCKTEGSVFCLSCQAAWWPDPDLTKHKGVIDQHFSLGSYRDVVLQKLLGLWKFHSVKHAKEALLKIVEQTVGDYAAALPNVDAVTFVPLHRRKKNERGFDQAEEVAYRVANVLEVPCLSLLTRTAYTAQQAQIDRDKRDAKEFDGIFVITTIDVPIPKRLLIVDDVWTTGTTLRSAAMSLRVVAVESICALTIAKG